MAMKYTMKLALAASALSLAGIGAAAAFDGQQYAKDAKITLEQARATVLQTVPGATIVDQELEHERGGSGLRYSFDLKVADGGREVGVDAVTGKVLENSVEHGSGGEHGEHDGGEHDAQD
jgi:hypothetical protein